MFDRELKKLQIELFSNDNIITYGCLCYKCFGLKICKNTKEIKNSTYLTISARKKK